MTNAPFAERIGVDRSTKVDELEATVPGLQRPAQTAAVNPPQPKPAVYPVKLSVWLQTEEGFDFNLEVQDVPSSKAISWAMSLSKMLESNNLKPSSQSQRNGCLSVFGSWWP